MKLTENTIFITGGGSGIGRGLAQAFHNLGNTVIISGPSAEQTAAVIKDNPGMQAVRLDVADPASITRAAVELMTKYPALNVLINDAGIMKPDGAEGLVDDALVSSTVMINLLGPIRMTSALIEQLKSQKAATVINVTSGMAFAPMAATATYCATKAGMHSYTLSQRYLLKDTSVRVLELAPPYVQTGLMGDHQRNDPRAMPLDEFVAATMKLLSTDADEILVDQVMEFRNNPGPNEQAFITSFNDAFSKH